MEINIKCYLIILKLLQMNLVRGLTTERAGGETRYWA